ncbi:unnamed protein product [Paramecium sonneborni]|uniref:Uncharacterized protein n=1 Tax=Paramecium sonneborni TaxID=65129 RepID=A0A8S1MUH8_9CILI|nr:unnamed protein product [Paramecium sonneborni]
MNTFACSDPTHQDSAEFFCINPFCQEDHLICFAQCFKTRKHLQHTKDIEKISELQSYIVQMKFDCTELLDQINLFQQQVKINLDKLKEGIQSKYLISQIQLAQLNAKQINQVLTSIIQFKEQKQALLSSLY